MIFDDDKTPPLLTVGVENGHTPLPLATPPSFVTPPPILTPRPTLTLKRPPLGRPAGAVSISEMIEHITKEVRRSATAELEHKHVELRAEIAAEIKTATGLGKAAILVNALAIVAVLATLALSRVLTARSLGLALAVLAAVFVGAARLGLGKSVAR